MDTEPYVKVKISQLKDSDEILQSLDRYSKDNILSLTKTRETRLTDVREQAFRAESKLIATKLASGVVPDYFVESIAEHIGIKEIDSKEKSKMVKVLHASIRDAFRDSIGYDGEARLDDSDTAKAKKPAKEAKSKRAEKVTAEKAAAPAEKATAPATTETSAKAKAKADKAESTESAKASTPVGKLTKDEIELNREYNYNESSWLQCDFGYAVIGGNKSEATSLRGVLLEVAKYVADLHPDAKERLIEKYPHGFAVYSTLDTCMVVDKKTGEPKPLLTRPEFKAKWKSIEGHDFAVYVSLDNSGMVRAMRYILDEVELPPETVKLSFSGKNDGRAGSKKEK